MIHHIERLLSGEIRKLAIVAPPRHGKTTLGNILMPAYALGRNPTETVISVSYGSDLSEVWGRRVRNMLGDPEFQKVFPNCKLSPDSAAAYRFTTTAGGEYNAVGRGGPITGKGSSLLVLDDLLKDATEAQSETTCTSVIEWLKFVALTRLTPNGRLLAVATRWSDRDPMGWILAQHGWTTLHLPAICQREDDSLGRKVGEALWPSQYPIEALEAIRRDIGGRAFTTLYQGDVSAARGTIFKREWFRYFDQPPENFSRIVQSWDTSFKTGKANDYSVCVTIGVTENAIYLLNVWRDRVEFPELKRQVRLQADFWKPFEIYIEDRASGQSLVQELKAGTTYPVIPVAVDRDKETRAHSVTGFFESGRVFFPRAETAKWIGILEDELCGFPGALHDDCVDGVTLALNRLRDGNAVYGVLELMRQGWDGFLDSFPHFKESQGEGERNLMKLQARPTTLDLERAAESSFAEASPVCPACKATCITRCSGQWRCSQCGHQWWNGNAPEVQRVSRGDILNGCIPSRDSHRPISR